MAKRNYFSHLNRIEKAVLKCSEQDVPRWVRLLDNVATIGSFFTTLVLGLITLCLTQKYGESEKQIQLLTEQVEILKTTFDPYVDGHVQEVKKINSYTLSLVFELENIGGNLKNLELSCEEKGILCNSIERVLKPTMGKNSRITGQINFDINDNLGSTYTLHYDNMMGERYAQSFRIFHNEAQRILQFIFEIPEKENN